MAHSPKKWLMVLSLLLSCFCQAHASAKLINEAPSVRGRMQLVENEQINSFLVFPQEQRQIALNSAWRETIIEHYTQVGDQTVVVMAYSEPLCSSRQALIVVTPRGFWGPYPLGGCDDTLIYQRSEKGDSFVALNPKDAMAWVYTANDERFRGPARIDLPEQLRQFVTNTSTPSIPVPTPPEPLPPIAPPQVAVPSATAQTTQKNTQSASATSFPPPAPYPLALPASGNATAQPQKQGPAANRIPKLSSADASVVAEKVAKTTKPQRQVVIDLM